MGSVPNCRKEIPVLHAIGWFKCKLKPPKNHYEILVIQTHPFACTQTHIQTLDR